MERSLDPATLARIREALAQVPGVAAVWVFGSFARGTAM
ncbi:MAG: nucleotidyltransferase domain-containing protein [Polyangiaceae bacterium]|nr:nucleotidyltransferase domain-containing protein [Polyangiaceae bacterium]MCE7890240.1 nucleotidyltransferase domain-containing protein [Sorangiineae bacterium PRO1]MCL4752717.1 nucleotidyltransferase domain-containing protein [Myxococcales bacterium]